MRRLTLGIAIAGFVVAVVMVITLLVMVYSWNHIPEPGNPKAFFILMLVLQTGMAGTFKASQRAPLAATSSGENVCTTVPKSSPSGLPNQR